MEVQEYMLRVEMRWSIMGVLSQQEGKGFFLREQNSIHFPIFVKNEVGIWLEDPRQMLAGES